MARLPKINYVIFATVLSAFALGSPLSIAGSAEFDSLSIERQGDGQIAVTLSGSGFGEKEQAPPLLWIFGDDVRENGRLVDHPPYKFGDQVSSSGPEIWEHVDSTVKYSSKSRYPGLQHSYFVAKDGTVREPLVFGGSTPPYAEKIYLSYRVKPVEPWHRLRSLEYTNVTGNFDLGPSRYEAGEQIVVTDEKNTSSTVGQIIYMDPTTDLVTLETKDGWGKSNLHNATVTGKFSGARMTLKTDSRYAFATGSKYLRMWSGGKLGLYNTLSTNRLIVGYRDNSGKTVVKPKESDGTWDTGYGIPDISNEPGWRLTETFIDQEGQILETYIDVDNDSRRYLRNIDITGTEKYLDRSPTISQLGLDAAGNADTIEAALHFGEIYFDNTAKRVMLSDQPTYSQAGQELELQLPLKWSEDSITFQLRAGSLDINDDIYAYIFDENSSPNEIGFPLCISCKLNAPATITLEVDKSNIR